MSHLSPSQLIQYAGGELSPAQSATLEAHLAECRACQTRVYEQQTLTNVLGEWQPDPRAADLTRSVLDRLDGAPPSLPRAPSLSSMLRIAAAILLGVGMGHAGGRLLHASDSREVLENSTRVPEPPDYELLSSPAPVGLWESYIELELEHREGTS